MVVKDCQEVLLDTLYSTACEVAESLYRVLEDLKGNTLIIDEAVTPPAVPEEEPEPLVPDVPEVEPEPLVEARTVVILLLKAIAPLLSVFPTRRIEASNFAYTNISIFELFVVFL
jgi:hypothetical protein